MKICPKCQQQFPNGFQYCPNDTELLIAQEDFNRRTRPINAAPVAKSVEPPISEVVPITNPFSKEEPPRVPPSSNVMPPPREPQYREMPPVSRTPNTTPGIRDPYPIETQAKDVPSGLPFRKTEPIAQNPPQNIPPQQNVPRPPSQAQNIQWQQNNQQPPTQPIANPKNTGVSQFTEQPTTPFQARTTAPQTPQYPQTGQV